MSAGGKPSQLQLRCARLQPSPISDFSPSNPLRSRPRVGQTSVFFRASACPLTESTPAHNLLALRASTQHSFALPPEYILAIRSTLETPRTPHAHVEHAIMNGFPQYPTANGAGGPLSQQRNSIDSMQNGSRMHAERNGAMPMPVSGPQRPFGAIPGDMQGFGQVGMPRSPPKNKSESILRQIKKPG